MDSSTQHPLSVVIATLGGYCLAQTIASLNSGNKRPAEILICIPEQEASRAAPLAGGNVRLIVTPCRGQVRQRAYGFWQVREPLVMHLDDDVLIAPRDLDRLIEALERLGPGNTVAPIYRDSVSGRCLHAYHSGSLAWLQHLYASAICGAPWGRKRMGRVSPSGVNYGVDENHCYTELLETQWQPGGCVLGFRDELVLDDYFPFAGKAFCEDLVHSLLRRQRGLRLWILSTAHCRTPAVPPGEFDWAALRRDFAVRSHVVKLSGGQAWRLRLWFLMDILKRLLIAALTRDIHPSRSK